MISAERLVELRAKVKKEMARRSCVEHGSSASMNKFAANYDYNAVPVTGGDITDEHIQKVIDPLLNVADFLQDNSLQQSHSGADVIVDQAEKFVDTLAKIDKQAISHYFPNSSFAISNRISTIASAIRSGGMTSEDFCNSLSGHGSCYSCKFYLDSKFLFL